MSDEPTKKAIIEATDRLLDGAADMDKITVREISREAGVPLASINYHFGSKDDLLGLVIERRMMPHIKEMYEDSARIENPRERLKRMLMANSSVAVEMYPVARKAVENDLKNGSRSTMLLIVPILRQIFGTRKIEPELRLLAYQLLIPLQTMFVHAELYREALEVDILLPEKRAELIEKMIDNLIPCD